MIWDRSNYVTKGWGRGSKPGALRFVMLGEGGGVVRRILCYVTHQKDFFVRFPKITYFARQKCEVLISKTPYSHIVKS